MSDNMYMQRPRRSNQEGSDVNQPEQFHHPQEAPVSSQPPQRPPRKPNLNRQPQRPPQNVRKPRHQAPKMERMQNDGGFYGANNNVHPDNYQQETAPLDNRDEVLDNFFDSSENEYQEMAHTNKNIDVPPHYQDQYDESDYYSYYDEENNYSIGFMFISLIPIVGLIANIVFAVSKKQNTLKRAVAKNLSIILLVWHLFLFLFAYPIWHYVEKPIFGDPLDAYFPSPQTYEQYQGNDQEATGFIPVDEEVVINELEPSDLPLEQEFEEELPVIEEELEMIELEVED